MGGARGSKRQQEAAKGSKRQHYRAVHGARGRIYIHSRSLKQALYCSLSA